MSSGSESLQSPVALVREIDTSSFDCLVRPLNEYGHRLARHGHLWRCAGAVSSEEVPARVAQGLGRGQLKDAVLRSLQVADIVGSRAVVTHAKDDAARKFYLRFQFAPSPVNEYHLYLLMKNIRAIFGMD